MNSRTFRTDEPAFEVQSDDSIATANGTSRCNGGLQALARIGDQSRKTARCAKPAVSARNRAHAVRGRLIVQKNPAAPIDLQVDKAGSEKGGFRNPRARQVLGHVILGRSEERRVGKECR